MSSVAISTFIAIQSNISFSTWRFGVCSPHTWLSYTESLRVFWVFAFNASQGVVAALGGPLGATFRHDLTPPKKEVRVNAVFGSALRLAGACGALVGGFVASHYGDAHALFVSSGGMVFGLVVALGLPSLRHLHSDQEEARGGLLKVGASYALRDASMRLALLVFLLASLLTMPIQSLLPDLAEVEIHGPRALGLATAALLGGGVLVAPLATMRLRNRTTLQVLKTTILSQGVLLTLKALLLFGSRVFPVVTLVILLCIGFSVTLCESLVLTVLQTKSSKQCRRAVLTLFGMLSLVAPLSGAFAALISEVVTIRPVLLTSGGVLLVTALVFRTRGDKSQRA